MSVLKVDELQSRTSGNRITLPDVNNYPPYRNLIINGDMSIAQRGTSFSGVSSNTFCTDRFELRNNIGAYTIAQETLTSGNAYNNGFRSAFRIDTTTADASPVSTSALFVRTKLEGQMLQSIKKGTANAEQLTLSFWVKSNQTGTGIVALRDIDNDRMVGGTYTISSADTWEKKTITFPADTTGAFDNDNAESINLEWWLDSGSNFNTGTLQTSWVARVNADSNVGSSLSIADSTSNDWAITGVQLEVGDSATPFEHLPYDVNLQRCHRYCQVIVFGGGGVISIGNSYNTTTAVADLHFNTMRAAPTVTFPTAGQSSGTASFLTAASAYPTTTGNFGTSGIRPSSFRITGSSYVGLNSEGVSWLYSNGENSFTLDAEL